MIVLSVTTEQGKKSVTMKTQNLILRRKLLFQYNSLLFPIKKKKKKKREKQSFNLRFFFFLRLEIEDVLIKVNKNMRQMRNSSHDIQM